MRGLALALQFLTRLPVRVRGEVTAADVSRSAAWFGVAGLVIGLLMAALDGLFGLLLPPWVRAALDALGLVLLTGGLHLDGLMDTADGIGSGKPAERALAIMRDSRVGAMGAIAGTLALVLRVALYASLPAGVRWPALVLAPVLGRTAIVWAAARYPSARAGLGSSFAAGVGRRELAWTLVTAALVTLLAGSGLPHAQLGVGLPGLALHAGVSLLLAAAAALLVAAWFSRRLGGQTGDTYGALSEVAELAALVAWTMHRG